MMKIFWYGNASLILKADEVSIAFDPFCKIVPGDLNHPKRKLPYEEELSRADYVFATHGHFDHIYHFPRLYGERNAEIFCTHTPAEKLLKKGMKKDSIHEIKPGFFIRKGPFEIRTWQGRHCRFDMPLICKTVFCRRFFRHLSHLVRLLWIDLTYRENGETLFYEILCEEKRIQVLGSMNLDGQEDYPMGADLLVLPLQGRSDQDTYALGIVERLQPKAVLLDHFDDAFEPLTSAVDVSGFIKNVTDRFHIPCFTIKPGEAYGLYRTNAHPPEAP